MELEYGYWCTVGGRRMMIVDWTETHIRVHSEYNNKFWVVRNQVSEISDFMVKV